MSTLLSNTIKPRSGDTVTFADCNISVGGTVTYEDVTNVDSVGVITARSGVHLGTAGAGGTIFSPASNTLVLGTNDKARVQIESDGVTHISNNTTDSAHWNSYNCHLLHTDATDFTTLVENSHDSNPNVLGLHMSDAAPNNGSSTYLQCYDTSGGTTTVRATITSDGTISDAAGNLRDITLRSVTGSAATLVLTDAGKVVSTDTTGWTVPALSWAAGDTVTLLNNSGGGLVITCSAVTTYLTSDGSTVTSKTLGARGMATLYFVSSSVAYLQGTSLS